MGQTLTLLLFILFVIVYKADTSPSKAISAGIHFDISVADPEDGPGGTPPPFIFRLKWGPKGRKIFFENPPPHLKVWIRNCVSLG